MKFALVAVLLFIASFAFADAIVIPAHHWERIVTECHREHVDPYRVARLLAYESGLNERLVMTNRDGRGRIVSYDFGLAQLNSRWLAYFAERYNDGHEIDPFDPVVSIRVAVRILADNYRQTGDWLAAFAAYNCGLAGFHGGSIPARTQRLIAYVWGNK